MIELKYDLLGSDVPDVTWSVPLSLGETMDIVACGFLLFDPSPT